MHGEDAGCRWDGGDCLGTCGAPTAAGDQCYIEQLGNGECDPECMSADCNYDYRDCECDAVLDSRGGYASDGLPERDYSNGKRFCWLTPPGKHPHVTKISLSFRRFDTEAWYDAVRVYDGPSTFAPQRSPAADGYLWPPHRWLAAVGRGDGGGDARHLRL